MKPIANFQHFPTHHCVTGALRHMYVHNQHELSEELLLGIGAGVGFCYFHFKGQAPFLGGRYTPKPSMEEIAGQRSGVIIQPHTTASPRRAHQALLQALEAGQPLMVYVDMGYLPYFDFEGQEYHFGGHTVVVCGYDPTSEQVLIADRDETLHPVSLADLETARSSPYRPFPPHNRWFTFDFTHKRQPTAAETWQAIQQQAEAMLQPPIRNLGVAGIRKASQLVPDWAGTMTGEELRWALFNTYIFISPVGGSGGGLFRFMFGRFLHEAAQLTSQPALEASAAQFEHIAEKWQSLGEWMKVASEDPHPERLLPEARPRLQELADLEENAWHRLAELKAVSTDDERQVDHP